MNGIPNVGELILIKTFFGSGVGVRFGQPDSLQNNLQITDNRFDGTNHIHIVTREQIQGREKQQKLAVISVIAKHLDTLDYS
jgi:hypothetical protein